MVGINLTEEELKIIAQEVERRSSGRITVDECLNIDRESFIKWCVQMTGDWPSNVLKKIKENECKKS